MKQTSKQTKTVILTTVITVILFGSIVFNSCTKSSSDPCASVVCLNGGTCSSGICSCPTGYTGANCQTAATTSITYQNTTFTPISITSNGNTSTIPVGGSITYSGAYGTTNYFTAYTSQTTNSGAQVGGKVTWNDSASFPSQGTTTKTLYVEPSIFFLEVKNNDASYSTNGIYVNYGTPAQAFENLAIPNNGTTYGIGYFAANAGEEIYTPYAAGDWYLYPVFPFTDNQYILMTLP